MILKRIKLKLLILCCLFMTIGSAYAQSCFSSTNNLSTCCSQIGFTFNPTISYAGNQAIVQFAPSYTFNPFAPCRFDTGVEISFDYGDGNFSPLYTFATLSSSLFHTYTLTNACVNNTFVVQACIKYEDPNQASNPPNSFQCLKDFTLSIPSPTSSIIINALNTSCKTYSFSFSGGPLTNVQWYFGDAINSPVIPTPTTGISHVYPSSGSYVVTLIADGFTACPMYTQVNVVDIVDPDFSYSLATPCSTAGGIVLTIPGYTNTLGYQWQINNLIVPSLGASATYTNNLTVVTNTVKLLISGGGCNTQVSKLIQMGTPNPTFAVNAASVCAGDVLSVYGVQSGGDSYVWSVKKPDNTFDSPLIGMNPNYMFTFPGTYTLTLTTTNTYTINNIVYTCSLVSPPTTVAVSAIPNPSFVFAPTICNGSIALNFPPSTFTSYTLDYGNSTNYTGGNSIPLAQAGNVYTLNSVYTVSLNLDNNGCVSGYSNNINVNSLTTLTITSPSSYLCAGSTASLNSLLSGVTNNAGTITYSWSGPGNFSSSNANIVVNAGGSYSLLVTSNGVCPINLSAVKSITALAAPVATLISVAAIDCASLTTSAVIEISAALQQQGYYINNVFTPANLLAVNPLQITVNGINNGVNYISIKNGISQDCQSNLLVNAAYNNPILTVASTQPNSCGLGALGSATATANPNLGTINWYKVSQFPTVLGTGNNISNLVPDNYQVKVIDGYCSATQFFSIAEPVINVSKSGPLGTCPNSSVGITINAAFVPASIISSLTYNWFQVVGNASTSIASGAANTQSIGAGNYYVTVTAANSCSTFLNFTLQEYEPITVNMETTLPTCKVQGVITANVSGGDGNYTYDWFFNNTNTNNNTNIQSLATLSTVTTVSLNINDQSGCSATAVPTPSVITPPSSVSLTACSGNTLQGLQNATKITGCDISACVIGGTAPYSFEWYKIVSKLQLVQWRFYYQGGQFIANNGTQTVLITPPTNSTTLASSTLNLNTLDSLETTVMYPYWTFTTSPAKPLLNPIGTFTLGSPTATTTDFTYYYTVNEMVKINNVEDFTAAYSGLSGQTYPHEKFTDGTYKLYVTDANGCRYPFNIGNLDFPDPTTFNITFDYVWGMGPVTPTVAPVDVVLHDEMIEASNEMVDDLDACLQKKVKGLNKFMNTTCTDLENYKDRLDLQYELKEHHHTLYYYDRAGQLTKTVPPEGVEYLSQADINLIKTNRSGSISTWTNNPHRMTTKYQYNSFGQLQGQETPDGGETKFVYDSKNRLRFSQNDKQKNAGTPVYSYTKYDELGRIIEVGESSAGTATLNFTNPTAAANLALADATVFPTSNRKQVTTTVYSSVTPVSYYGKPQRFVQNRVSFTTIDEDPLIAGNEHYTFYSYDNHGNVEWLVQDDPNGIGKNYMSYEYDLVSGKVLKVTYNENRLDRFYHRYVYDAENRLVKTQTSRDGQLWDEDAAYAYYPHGPLKRSVIGEDHVQGLDYIYTAQGWIKSINSPSLVVGEDPGNDNGTFNAPPIPQDKTAADRFGMVLNYFNGDYTRTGNFLTNANNYALVNYSTTGAPSLYNGNISSWVQSQLNTITTNPIVPRADLYQYDLLNRIKQSISLEASITSTTSWAAINTNTATFKTSYDYDANGNILSLKRYDDNGVKMDDFNYTYDNGAAGTASLSNRLTKVEDTDLSFLNGRGDLEGTHTYSYDPIGNLVKEVGVERINLGAGTQSYVVNTDISWTVYGKIKEVLKANDPSGLNRKERVTFAYDASGNRTKKEYWKDAGSFNSLEEPEEITTTYYVRDAQGNVMSIYKKFYDVVNLVFKYDLEEQPIYGSDRLGQNTHSITLASNANYSNLTPPVNGFAVNSEYQNWMTGTNKSQLLPNSGATNDLCQCKVMSISNSTSNPNYSSVSTAVEFLGIANNGIAIAEDLTGTLQFYVVLAKKYLGNADACLVFDKFGKLMQGTELIGSVDVNSKPVIVNVPGTKLYNIIALNAAKQPVSHLVDMNQAGYGPVGLMGKVISVNQPLTANTNTAITHGFHFTAAENHIAGEVIVYSSRYTPDPNIPDKGTTDILAYSFGGGTATPVENLVYSIYGCGNTETGELQLSPNGNKLGWYQHDKTISGFKTRTGYIYTMPLSPSKISVSGTVDVHPISSAGNYGNGALEFMTNNNDVLFAQRGMYKEGNGSQKYDKNVWKYDPINLTNFAINPDNLVTPVNVSYLFGEIKRGTDGRFYIPNMGTPANKIHSYTGSGWTGTVNVNEVTYEFASSMPTQVWKLYIDPSQILSEYPRYIGDKGYELKDHLGNVKVVLSDEKLVIDNNTNDLIENTDDFQPVVLNYNDYYAFGSQMPGRKYTSGNRYRYGFNGMERDDEVKGGGNSYTTEFRQYDPRLGRWLSIDPAMAKYPDWSPYVFAFDNPIWFHDPNGDDPPTVKEIVSAGKKSSTTFAGLLKVNKISTENAADIIFFNAKQNATLPSTKNANIVLTQSDDIKFQVIKLTHELTNRKNVDVLRNASSDVESGKISPQEYAKKLTQIEVEGEINQIKVAAETGFRYKLGNKEMPMDKAQVDLLNKTIDEYSKDKTIDLKKRVLPNEGQMKFYEGQGQKLKDAFDAKKSQNTEEKKGG